MPVTILDAGDIEVNKVGSGPALAMLEFRWGEQRGREGMIIENKYYEEA